MGRHLQLSLGTVDGKISQARQGVALRHGPIVSLPPPPPPDSKLPFSRTSGVRREGGLNGKNFASPVPRLGHNIEDWGWSGGAGGSIEALASTMIQLSQWTWQARFGLAKYFPSPVWMSQRRPNSYVSPYVSSSQPRSGFAYRSPSQAWPPRRTPKHLG